MTQFKKFLPEHLNSSENRFIQRLKWKRSWHCVPGKDFKHDEFMLIKDALRNLYINGELFLTSPEFTSLSSELRGATINFGLVVEPAFKCFLQRVLFPTLDTNLFEEQYAKLKAYYGQLVLGDAIHALKESACGRFASMAGAVTVTLESGTKVDNLTYVKGTFYLETTITDLNYTHSSGEETYQATLPTIVKYRCSMPSTQNGFSMSSIETSNAYSEALLFEQDIDVKKMVELEEEIKELDLLNQFHTACEEYKNYLKTEVFTQIQKEDPVFATFFTSKPHVFQVDTYLERLDSTSPGDGSHPSKVNIISPSEATGLDILVNDPLMEEKITFFSQPAQLAIKKYKVMCEMQKVLKNEDDLELERLMKFNTLMDKNEKLLKTSRDTGIVTFFKVVACVVTFGAATSFLFSTKGHALIDKVNSIYAQPKPKTKQIENPNPEMQPTETALRF